MGVEGGNGFKEKFRMSYFSYFVESWRRTVEERKGEIVARYQETLQPAPPG